MRLFGNRNRPDGPSTPSGTMNGPMRSTYRCPFCLSYVEPGDFHYLCLNEGCPGLPPSEGGPHEVDPERSIYLDRDPTSPDAVMSKHHITRGSAGVCDVCGGSSVTKLCPVCHGGMFNDVDGIETILVAGDVSTGKTHYMTTLIDTLRNTVSEEFGFSFEPVDVDVAGRYLEDYHDRLFIDRRRLTPTKSLDISCESAEPLVYYLRVDHRGDRRVYAFIFHDLSGADFVRSNGFRIRRYVAAATGILYLVDPLQLKPINDSVDVPNKPLATSDPSRTLDNICKMLCDETEDGPLEGIEVPLAVCLTKCDILMGPSHGDGWTCFGPESAVSNPRRKGICDRRNFDQMDVELKEYLRRAVGEHFVQTIEGFQNHSVFALSALGTNPIGARLPGGVRPFRVEDPFIWLCDTIREGRE